MSAVNHAGSESGSIKNELPSFVPPPIGAHAENGSIGDEGGPNSPSRVPSIGPSEKGIQVTADRPFSALPITVDLAGDQELPLNPAKKVETTSPKEPTLAQNIQQSRPYVAPPFPTHIRDSDELWRKANKVADSIVEDQTKAMNGSLDTTLIFAGLFSAVNSTLLSISLPSLSPDLQEESNQLLRLLVTNDATLPQSPPFKPSPNALRDNILFATSLLFSLFAAFGAVLGKQWLIYYANVTPGISDKKEAEERQAKVEGATTWQLQLLLEMLLPSTLQISLTLFIIGMIDFFWSIHPALGIWNGSLAGLASVLFFTTIALAIIYPKCPFQSPLSKFVWPAILRTVPQELPFWLTRGSPTSAKPHDSQDTTEKPHSLNLRNRIRSWLDFDAFHWRYVTLYSPSPPVSSEDLICQSAVFTLTHTDELASSLAAANAIPTITSREKLQQLAKDASPFLLDLFAQSISQLRHEAVTGCESETLTSAALFSRVLLHLYVSGTINSRLDGAHWWKDLDYGHLRYNFGPRDVELAHLNDIVTWEMSAECPAPAVYMAASLMRYVEHPTDKRSVKEQLRKVFGKMIESTLAQPCPGSNVSLCANGLRYVFISAYPLDVDRRDETALSKLIQNRWAQKLRDGQNLVWELYSRHLMRSRQVEFDWRPSVISLFETWSEEIQEFLNGNGEASSTVWRIFVDRITAKEEPGYTKDEVATNLLALLMRLDMRRMVCKRRGTLMGSEGLFDYVYERFTFTMKHVIIGGFSRLEWVYLRSLVRYPRHGSRAAGTIVKDFVHKLTYIVMEAKSSTIDILSQQEYVIEGIGRAINHSSHVNRWATMWALVHQAQPWFDHQDQVIHSRFIEAGVASGVIVVLARTLARAPYRDLSEVLEEAEPLLAVLIKHPCWIIPLVEAVAADSIATLLERGPALITSPLEDWKIVIASEDNPGIGNTWEPDDDTWRTEERDLRAEVARTISEAAIAFMLREWYQARTSQTDEETSSGVVVDDVWFKNGVVEAIIHYLETEHHKKHREGLDVVLHTYAEDLRGLGQDRTDCSDELRQQMDDWDSKSVAKARETGDPSEAEGHIATEWSSSVP